MELVVVTLLILAIFQAFQTPIRQQDKQAREALDLMTLPVETAATANRIRLLVDADEPDVTFSAFTPVNVYSVDERLETVVSTFASSADETGTVVAEPVSSAELLEVVIVPADRVLAEDQAIAAAMTDTVAADSVECSGAVEVVPFAEERRAASLSRKDAVFALLDEAASQGVSGYAALNEYVKQHSGQGTSRSTIQAWKKAREAAPAVDEIANG